MVRVLVLALLVTACAAPNLAEAEPLVTAATSVVPGAEDLHEGPIAPELRESLDRLLTGLYTQSWDLATIEEVASHQDLRAGWLLADLMRFYQTGPPSDELVFRFAEMTGVPPDATQVGFVWATNYLIANDVPDYDGYIADKAVVFTPIEDKWQQFFDESFSLDWRIVTWGGVLADERALGDNTPCNCIPALDYPETTDADGGDWYGDDRVVFGVVVGEDAIALPKHQMEVHEMVNLTLGGRELGIPYCTLCASAQAYYVDDVPGVERVVLRTSGLLQRSNKLMYDLTTGSAINTFTGEAVTGPLARNGVVLNQVSVVASTWDDWKTAHPDTRILAEDGGLGRSYDDDPLGGRDDNGPIFPIGDVDNRLPVQEKVVGVVTADGLPVAFPVNVAREALASGPIEYEGLTLRFDDSIRVYDEFGSEVTSHEAFWFAWSQFHPTTVVWSPVGS